MKAYTGIGTRSTPAHIQELMNKIGFKLAELGYTLRSGAAEGADKAFEIGVKDYFSVYGEGFPALSELAQIYIPWRSFSDIDEHYKDWYRKGKTLAAQTLLWKYEGLLDQRVVHKLSEV